MDNFNDKKDKDGEDSHVTENPDEESNPTAEKFRRLIISGEESKDSQKIQQPDSDGSILGVEIIPGLPSDATSSIDDTKELKLIPDEAAGSKGTQESGGSPGTFSDPYLSGNTIPPDYFDSRQTPFIKPVSEVGYPGTTAYPAVNGPSNQGSENLDSPYRGAPVLAGSAKRKKPTQSLKLHPKPRPKNPSPKSKRPGNRADCLLKSILLLFFAGIVGAAGVFSFGIYKYFSIAASLPNVSDLRQRASQFETTRILDRDGNVLYEILDPNAGRRTYVTLDKISPNVLAAMIATEDKEFYNNPGFDPIAIARALFQNYTSGEIVSGASTITQQLSRIILLDPAERYEQTVERKTREIVLAAEITRRYSKDEILELYLNEIYYGNLAYGIQAAAETYFETKADDLTLGQAAFLAGLPQAPSVYDITTNRDATLRRAKQVLVLLYQDSQEKGCIEVSNSDQAVCVDAEAASLAAEELDNYPFEIKQISYEHPHWVNYIRAQLEDQFDAQTIYRSGFSVFTTLDPELQVKAEEIVKDQVSALADRNATNGALVAMEPSTGEILAMVGSADFNNEEISGQVNMAISPRQPGSSIKPLTYLAAFEKGWTPATMIWDVESEFPPSGDPNDPREPYIPVNYDGEYHGPFTVRTALANSINVPAVKTLDFVKIYDDPNTPDEDGFIHFAEKMGITTLDQPDYGLSLTLGGGDVTLAELTSAYATMANAGLKIPPYGISKIEDYRGNLIYEYEPPDGVQVIRPEYAYQMSSILSDNEARSLMFGRNSILNLGFDVAAKTGTTNDFRDNWTMGYTPDLAVGVWVGNADYTPMQNSTGLSGAAPIWSEFTQYAIDKLTDGNPTPFSRPDGIIEKVICEISGTEPSEWCPSQRSEIFAFDQLPPEKENDLWQEVKVDTWTELKSSSYCSEFIEERFVLNVEDKWAKRWIEDTGEGREWAESIGFEDDFQFSPDRECNQDDPRPTIIFAGLQDGDTIQQNPFDIYAVIRATDNFDKYRLSFGLGDDPDDWETLIEDREDQYEQPEMIYSWDVSEIRSDEITLWIYLESTQDTFAEKKITLNLDVPEPTPTETPFPTETPLPSDTPIPTETPYPIIMDTQEPIITETIEPTTAEMPMETESPP